MDPAGPAALGSLLTPANAEKFLRWIRRCQCVGIVQDFSAPLEILLPSLHEAQGGNLGHLLLPDVAAELAAVLNWSPELNALFLLCCISGRKLQDWPHQKIQDAILQKFFDHPQEARKALGHLMLMKWAQMTPGQDNDRTIFYQHRQTAVQDLLVPGLNFDLGRFSVDYRLLCDVPVVAPDHGVICEWLGLGDIQDDVAVEALRYAATLVQYLLLQLHCHIMSCDPDQLEYGLFSPRGDGPFDVLWNELAVRAGSNLTLAIRRIRWGALARATLSCNRCTGTCRCHLRPQSYQTCHLSFLSWQKKAHCPLTLPRASGIS
jgi:hypothetical protein